MESENNSASETVETQSSEGEYSCSQDASDDNQITSGSSVTEKPLLEEYHCDESHDINVGMGKYAVIKEGCKLMTMGIGSCIATLIYDSVAKVYGMAHIMLPFQGDFSRKTQNANKYADVGIRNMIHDMEELGAKRGNMKAKIAGGAHMFPSLEEHPNSVNRKNAEAVRQVLAEEGIKIVAEDIGGNSGRTIIFNIEDEEFKVIVKSEHIERIL